MQFAFARTCFAIAFLSFAPLRAQTTTRVSVDSAGTQVIGNSVSAAISADGLHVAFVSDAVGLVPGDSNGVADVFERDLTTGVTIRVSVATGGAEANAFSVGPPAISSDGRYVAFKSFASNLISGDTNTFPDVFVHDAVTGATTLVSVGMGGQSNGQSSAPSISGDGRYVAYESIASNQVGGDTNFGRDIFVRDRTLGTTVRASVSSSGGEGNGSSYAPALSADGRVVAFMSDTTNLVSGDTNSATDVFARDLVTLQTTRVDLDVLGGQANGAASGTPSISADGRFVAFASAATNLTGPDANGVTDVFVRDRSFGGTVRASIRDDVVEPNGASASPSISADGRYVAFHSVGTNLFPNDTNAAADVFVFDATAGVTEHVSLSASGANADASALAPSISSDARYVAFEGAATNLVPGDTNSTADIFRRDRGTALAPFCFGDGLFDPMVPISCPCGNYGTRGHGCGSSYYPNGAQLIVTGAPNPDTVVLHATHISSTSIYLQGDMLTDEFFGDGVRCAGGALIRLRTKTGGDSEFPEPGDPSVSTRGSVTPGSGDVRYYQTYYRNAAAYCLPATFNVTNGIRIVW